MSTFEYQALDTRGRKKKGVVEADTPRQARQQLRDQGLTPLSVDTAEQDQKRSGRGVFGGPRIGKRDLTLITRQLATLSQSGLPLDEVLNAVSRQTEKKAVHRILLGLRGKSWRG